MEETEEEVLLKHHRQSAANLRKENAILKHQIEKMKELYHLRLDELLEEALEDDNL